MEDRGFERSVGDAEVPVPRRCWRFSVCIAVGLGSALCVRCKMTEKSAGCKEHVPVPGSL